MIRIIDNKKSFENNIYSIFLKVYFKKFTIKLHTHPLLFYTLNQKTLIKKEFLSFFNTKTHKTPIKKERKPLLLLFNLKKEHSY
jgi:hypothetical protein